MLTKVRGRCHRHGEYLVALDMSHVVNSMWVHTMLLVSWFSLVLCIRLLRGECHVAEHTMRVHKLCG